MSELTLFLIRVAYLAILWIFVLSAISVIRSDMFGARVPEAARGAAPARKAEARREAAEPSAAAAPATSWSPRARNVGERAELDQAPILIGRGSDAAIRLDDDYVSTRHARIAASGDQWFVEDLGSTNGTYIGTRPDHPAHHHHARHPGPHRQDDPRAEEVADDASGCASHFSAISDVGRVRKDNQDSGYVGPWLLAVCDGVGGAARGDIASSTAIAAAAQARRDPARPGTPRRPARPGRRRAAPRPRPDRRAGRRGPRPQRHQHHRDRRALRRRSGSAWATSATAAPTSSAAARSASSPTTTRSCRPSSTRAGSPRTEARVHPHRNLILKALDGIHDARARPVRRRARARRPAAAVQRRRQRRPRRRPARRHPLQRHPRLRRRRAGPRQPRGRQLRQRHLPGRRRGRAATPPTTRPPSPLLVGAAADMRARRTRAAAKPTSLFRGHRAGDTGELEPIRGRDPRRRSAVRDLQRPDPTPRRPATPRAPPRPLHLAAAGCWPLAVVRRRRLDRRRRRWSWSQEQYYVGEQDGTVVIFRGIDATLPGVDAVPRPTRPPTSPSTGSRDFDADKVREGIDAASLADAHGDRGQPRRQEVRPPATADG